MKNSERCMNVYLALFLLIVLVAVFPYREGFDGDKWYDFTPWFMKKESDSKEKNKDASDNEFNN